MTSKSVQVQGRVWLSMNGKSLLGKGRLELLRQIEATGSISKAAKAMKMSYKAAWDAVDAMNAAWGLPLVASGPAGSRLTPDAEHLIDAYQKAEARHAAFMEKLAQDLPARHA